MSDIYKALGALVAGIPLALGAALYAAHEQQRKQDELPTGGNILGNDAEPRHAGDPSPNP